MNLIAPKPCPFLPELGHLEAPSNPARTFLRFSPHFCPLPVYILVRNLWAVSRPRGNRDNVKKIIRGSVVATCLTTPTRDENKWSSAGAAVRDLPEQGQTPPDGSFQYKCVLIALGRPGKARGSCAWQRLDRACWIRPAVVMECMGSAVPENGVLVVFTRREAKHCSFC